MKTKMLLAVAAFAAATLHGPSSALTDVVPMNFPALSFGGNLQTGRPGAVEVSHVEGADGLPALRADGHAPIAVMGDHMHEVGEWMVSYRYMTMRMEDSLNGTDELSPDTIVTTIANRFGPPSYLRVVPLEMRMDMYMVGAMYAPTDWLTLMAMGGYTIKTMSHRTYAGMSGTTVRGNFDVDTKGISDTRVSGLIKLYRDGVHRLHANPGLSLPTGSGKEQAEILTPAGGTPKLRAPYAMQLGSGTFDVLPGLTYNGRLEDLSWGAQVSGFVPIGKNGGGYSLGRSVSLNTWAAYQWASWISTSFRVTGSTTNKIDGIDAAIAVPNQTADPDNYGENGLTFPSV